MVGSSCHIQENQNEITQVHSICFCNLGQQIVGQETGNLPCVVTTTYDNCEMIVFRIIYAIMFSGIRASFKHLFVTTSI